VINGVPRSGKTSLALEIMAASSDHWVNVGVDSVMAETADHFQPGIGLRPGGERPDLEQLVLISYEHLFSSVAGHLRAGVNVVADVGIHDDYRRPLDIVGVMRDALADHDVLFVGLHCSLVALRERRELSGYLTWQPGEPIPDPVVRWQRAVHRGKAYDLELDTTSTSASACAVTVLSHLRTSGLPDRLTMQHGEEKVQVGPEVIAIQRKSMLG